jgi:hypothetical protein
MFRVGRADTLWDNRRSFRVGRAEILGTKDKGQKTKF